MSEAIDEVRDRYARFAADEAPGRSELYAAWARGVAESSDAARVLARIPATHRQPALVFAVARMLGSGEGSFGAWASWVRRHADDLVAECSVRTLQTNEPLRAAALLPALSLIDGPVALLEVGASAGLCLYPDRYSYRYRTGDGVVALDPVDGPSAVVLESDLRGEPELRMPDVVWRAGIDLRPLDATEAADRAWIEGLVWPGEEGRRERMSAALDIVAAAPPRLVAGDAVERLADLAEAAPQDATLVITTPGVLPYVPRARRHALVADVRRLGRWITIDRPDLLDVWEVPGGWPAGRSALGLDGRILAAVDPLGAATEWLPGTGRPVD